MATGNADTAGLSSAEGASAHRRSAIDAGQTSSILETANGTRAVAVSSTPPQRGEGVGLWTSEVRGNPPVLPRDLTTTFGRGTPPPAARGRQVGPPDRDDAARRAASAQRGAPLGPR